MTITAAIRTAQSALQTTAAQTAITSRNVAGASDPGYSRKIALVSTGPGGGSQILSITRATDKALYESMIGATSRAAAQQALVEGLNNIDSTLGDPEADRSPAALIGALTDTIQLYSASPGDQVLAQSVLVKAKDLANSLNDAASTVQDVRQQADSDMATAVGSLNDMLAKFERLNSEIVIGTRSGADVTDKLDARDRLLSQMSELMGISTATRGDNDTVIYTDSGVTLFETTARQVSFVRTVAMDAGVTGNAVYVDGVPVTGSTATMPLNSGRLQGLAMLRDQVAVTYQNQLDEIARGLIGVFAETDQGNPPSLPDQAGLFTWPGGPALPGGSLVTGLAGAIRVNPNVDPAQGGNLARLRDGGISNPGNPAYVYNATGAAGYSERLNQFVEEIAAGRSFDAQSGIDSSASVSGFASSSISWFQSVRQTATNNTEYQTTLLNRASEALSNATGVNLDDEMALLLEIERSYQASSKLLATVDAMLATFIAELR